ncbi:DUF6216 family protein [Pseudomonas sp. RTB3]|uniref:DUF6216 family protein n=1 Tax=unclassified Pseudomonas TaxID=196821 RepID=UPI002B232FA8|nr:MULTISPECIES: DUF6216 family protein [unclassified Pseudomonas]MEB0009126.1 DUF6216 family protein [Pseudomonas sp. RTB2]MEB0019723.1 DUF6216 family protein [Pseudomonas sp. RTB3]MEB0272196.1 DUF6216 family protein [Pseudomonas sp. 5B4]
MTEQTFTSVMHFLDVLYKLWPIACSVFVFCLVVWRTRSFFFLFHQIFNLLGLEGKYNNAEDQKATDDYLDLNKFNLKTGFRLQSVKAKTELHTWMQTHKLELIELRNAGWYFKANSLSFDLPGKLRLCSVRVVFILLGTFFVLTAKLVENPDRALLKVTATDTWFWVGGNEAVSVRYDFPDWLRGEAWKLQQGDCRYEEDERPLRNSWDKDVMCHLVLGFREQYITDAIASQQRMGGVLGLLGIAFFALLGIFSYWQSKAVQIHNELRLDS